MTGWPFVKYLRAKNVRTCRPTRTTVSPEAHGAENGREIWLSQGILKGCSCLRLYIASQADSVQGKKIGGTSGEAEEDLSRNESAHLDSLLCVD